MKKQLLFLAVLFCSISLYAQETICDGEWVEQIISYDCSSFNSSATECNNHSGCWFEQNAYVGIYVFEDRCWGGTQTMNNSYCDGEMVSVFLGCTDENAINYNELATEDDDSCEWQDCEGLVSFSSLNILVEDSICHSNLYCEDYNWDGGDCVFDCNNDLMTLWDIDTYFYNGQCDQILNCMFYNYDNESCLENTNSNCQNIYITLNNGWNMIGFPCSSNLDAVLAFEPIQNEIIIVKDGVGNAYLPSWEYNGIGDLVRGYGYLLKVSEEINNYSICEQ